jgi:hypothetical protein
LNEELVMCGAGHDGTTRIMFKVTQCSTYDDERLPSYFELMNQAWILMPASRRRPSGFVRATDLRDEEYAQVVANFERRDVD